MGFFTGLDAEGYDRQYNDRQLIKRIAGYFKPFQIKLIWITILLLLIAGAGAVSPVIVARIVDAI